MDFMEKINKKEFVLFFNRDSGFVCDESSPIPTAKHGEPAQYRQKRLTI